MKPLARKLFKFPLGAIIFISCPLSATVPEATGGRGRAVERAHFLRKRDRTRQSPAPRRCSVRVQTCFEAFTRSSGRKVSNFPPSVRWSAFIARKVFWHELLSVDFTRCRLPIQEDPLGIPLRAPQATYTKRDALSVTDTQRDFGLVVQKLATPFEALSLSGGLGSLQEYSEKPQGNYRTKQL